MFTGLITERGVISDIARSESAAIFTVRAPHSVAGMAIGDSIAVNGVCLTATSLSADSFTADVMVQTLSLTSLAQLNIGATVNLELAAQLSARMGGHMVQGHVDGVGTILQVSAGDKWTQMDVTVPEHLMKYIVAQGSITLDGV